MDNQNFEKAVRKIDESHNILLTTHVRPDGDACASVVAMYYALEKLGKKVGLLFLSEIPEWYEFLFPDKPPVLKKGTSVEQLVEARLGRPDLIIIIDTNSYSQLPGFETYLKNYKMDVLVIDHHATADGLGDVELVDTEAAATGLIVFDFIKYAGWPITNKIAEALFVATSTDTGWFQFGNTNSRVFRSCAELVDAGAEPAKIHHILYRNFSIQRFKLMTSMLQTLELHFGGRYAVQHLTIADFKRTGASYKDTENLIDECRRIATVEAAALFVEQPDGRIRCSLRSTGSVDVRQIAQKFGGGGHKMAAGTYLPGPLQNAKQLILEQIEPYLS